MGPAIVMGAYFVMAMHFSSAALWASMPLGFLVAGILHANNIRDIESDTRHGKRTLATILGRAGANYELIALDVAAYVVTIVAILSHVIPWIALVVSITVPRALDQIRIITRENEPKKLNLGLFRSIQLHMEFGLLMIAAFLVAGFAGW
jgi:1,4-dihydroxy-2-naphthoate polyprenyltransferase